MDPKIFFITLPVDDLDRSLAFYRDGLGWPTEGIVGRSFTTRPPAPTVRSPYFADPDGHLFEIAWNPAR